MSSADVATPLRNLLAELEVCLAVNPVVDATLAATTALFDALGASATASTAAIITNKAGRMRRARRAQNSTKLKRAA